jgi:anti-sigma B factor antagonist
MFCHPFLAVLRPSAKDAKMDINLFHYFPPDTQVLTRLDAIEQKLDRVLKVEQRMENTMALDFTKMIAATTAQTTVTNSVLQTLTDLAAKITDLSAQLAAAIAANDPVAQAAVQTQLDAGNTAIVLGMQGVEYIDSAGLGELVACKKRASAKGGNVKLVMPSESVYKVLSIVSLHLVFEIFDNEAKAIASF